MADLLPFQGLITGGNQPNYGKIAASSEAKRKGLIDLGLQQINAVYSGGSAPFYNPAYVKGKGLNPTQTYYSIGKGGSFTPYWQPGGTKPGGQSSTSLGGQVLNAGKGDILNAVASGGASFLTGGLLGSIFGSGRKKISPLDVARKAYAKGQLFTGGETQNFEGFQEPFFEKRAQDYVNYAAPKVAQQYRDNRDAINYGLFNRGLGGSSVANLANSRVERTADEARQTVADTGLEQANTLRKDVEGARQENINQLYQSANPAQALQSSIASASQFQRAPTFAPIADLFSNLARQYYVNQTLNNYRAASGGAQDTGSTNFSAPLGPTYK